MASQTKTNAEIIKPGTHQLTQIEEVPEFLRKEMGNAAGLEDVAQSDILIPRLGLCQALSPQKRKSHSLYIEGLAEGQLFNTVTQEIYGDSLDVILLFFFKNRIKYIPIDDGGGIDCMSTDGLTGGRYHPDDCGICQFSKFGNGAEAEPGEKQDPPMCTMYHNLMSFIPKVGQPIAISFKSTGLKVTKQLLGQIRLSRMPMYAKHYHIDVTTARSGDQEWYEKRFTAGKFVDEKMFSEMEAAFKSLKEANVKVDTTGEDTDFDVASQPYHTPVKETEL